MIVLEAVDIVRTYTGGDGGTITVLDGVDLQVSRGEMVAIIGASGAGKSTLLHLLGALDRPTAGEVRIGGRAIGARAGSEGAGNGGFPLRFPPFMAGAGDAVGSVRSDEEISQLRNHSIGFVFQFHHLLREFSAVENVMMPLWIAGWESELARPRAVSLLQRVGLADRMSHRPSELSGGEQQRTAVARALAMDPSILLLDEPSGNLDHGNSERLHDLLVEISRDLEVAMVVVTHNRSLAMRADRVLVMDAGKLHHTDIQQAIP